MDEPVAQVNGATGQRRFLIKDERGSVTARTDDGGVVRQINTYDAYGNEGDVNAGVRTLRLLRKRSFFTGYTGQQRWFEYDLVYYKAFGNCVYSVNGSPHGITPS
ncbi:MAG: hypothetical protein AAGD92_06370 [Pseudomonadota bacterium]